MANYDALGVAIREARERVGKTQSELGQSLGVSRATISLMENGYTRHPRMDHILAIERILDLPPGTLFAVAGLSMPETATGQVTWLSGQLDEPNRRRLVEIGYALLRVQQDQQPTADPASARPGFQNRRLGDSRQRQSRPA